MSGRTLRRMAARGLVSACLVASVVLPLKAQDESIPPVPETETALAQDGEVPPAPVPANEEFGPLDPVGPEATAGIEGAGDDGYKPLNSIMISITPTRGDLPPDHASPRFANETTNLQWPGVRRPWCLSTYCWDAPWSRHFPLYFEDPNLERYGWNFGCLQPVVSGVKFYTTIPILPYKCALGHYCCPTYTLGHYRPGNCVPYQCHLLPWSPYAAAVQAGAAVGAVYAIP